MIPRRGRKTKILLSVVIPVVKAAFVPFSARGRNPANTGVTRLCGVSPHPIPDTATALPNVAPYQLSHTRIFNFCHDTTTERKIKDFSVCGHLCGQSRFYAVFGNRRKPRKRRRRKALRRFTLPRPGYRHGTPKCGTVPTPPYPDRGGGYAARSRTTYPYYIRFSPVLQGGNQPFRAAFRAATRSVASQRTPRSSRPMWP